MSTVTLTIGPKNYSVACADGQEAHIQALGALIAEKYAQLGSSRAPLEAQNLLFAALFLADELAEVRKQVADTSEVEALRGAIADLEAQLAATPPPPAPEPTPAPTPAPAPSAPQIDLFGGPDTATLLAEQLEALADRAEATAAALEAVTTSA
jgi:cell division protein ZapA